MNMEEGTKESGKHEQEHLQTHLMKRKRKRSCCSRRRVAVGMLIPLGILLAAAGVVLPKFYKDTLKKKLVLRKGNSAFKNWRVPASPVYMTYHVFNYTNVDEIMNDQATPHVSQVGPFTYREIRINEVLDYNEYNITYLQNYSFVFEPSMSCPTCSESDIVFVPSISLLTLLNKIGGKGPGGWFKQFTINAFFNSEAPELFKKVTVYQSIWGYEDDLLNTLRGYGTILKLAGFKAPDSATIALQHNGTDGANRIGNITVLTGKENVDDVQRIVGWRGLNTAPYWLTKYAEMINGTDGTHTPPFLERSYKYYVFVTQLCRSLYFEYKEDTRFRDILLYRFSTTEYLFMNESGNPDNAAFCSDNKTCWNSGLLPISKCKPGGPPIFMSSPHFYQGDPTLVKRIKGLHPNATLHESILDVEPTTGITLRAYKRLQINVMGRRTSWLKASHPLRYKYNFLPLLMIEEVAAIDPKSAAKFRRKVLRPRIILGYAHYVLIAVGGSIVLAGIILMLLLISKYYKDTYTVVAKYDLPPPVTQDEVTQIS